jgi:signal recognition particle subunit SRP54
MARNQFTLEDFRSQLGQFKKLGSMSKIMKMLPEQMMGGLQLSDEQSVEVEAQMKRTEAIIDSMTRKERNDHKLLDASRKTRVAKGSGSTIAEVNSLLRQYEQMKKVMQQMNKGGLFGGLGRKMMGGLAGGLGGMLGGGGGMGGLGGLLGGGDVDHGDDGGSENGSLSKKLKKKKRHKKRR